MEAKTRRSGYPRDLREDGPAGPVERHWQPEAFTWFGQEARKRGFLELFVYIGKSQFRVSSATAVAAGLKPGDMVEIGVNKQFLAIRKSERGIPARSDRNKNATNGLCISASKLIEKLVAEGWPVTCRLQCEWDDQNRMLVARKPGEVSS